MRMEMSFLNSRKPESWTFSAYKQQHRTHMTLHLSKQIFQITLRSLFIRKGQISLFFTCLQAFWWQTALAVSVDLGLKR